MTATIALDAQEIRLVIQALDDQRRNRDQMIEETRRQEFDRYREEEIIRQIHRRGEATAALAGRLREMEKTIS